MSVNAWDTKVTMLSSLLLTTIRILLCFFFLFLVLLSNFFIIGIFKENATVNTVLAIPTGASTIVAWETIKTAPAVAERKLKFYLFNQK